VATTSAGGGFAPDELEPHAFDRRRVRRQLEIADFLARAIGGQMIRNAGKRSRRRIEHRQAVDALTAAFDMLPRLTVRLTVTGMRATAAPAAWASAASQSPLAKSPGAPARWMPLRSNVATSCAARATVNCVMLVLRSK
jgi:hypothetical protein